ncbi:Xylose isomerase-like TIM barrel [Verrucomicrobium sp. GAS474]|uniref:sugar phosphate isomerase/epimerase family protein n=1 Tax=Verrucomicrobium sp. GAS474 TaxID=1882831 RepID=UPI00087A5869|nr:TIM barrel protein [Verrucomicrobium sp. GAS474]SDT97703.1 Xylose isomerase-like TIM barrel [Verrucomicrobium sp. GAS474]
MLTPGLVSVTFRPLSPAEIIALVVRSGLKAIEWGGDIHVPADGSGTAAEVGRMTRDAGLLVSSYGSYYRVGEGQPFEPVLAAAVALGAPAIRVWSGAISSAEATEADRERVAADYRRIAALAAAQGLVVANEFHDHTLTDDAPTTLAMFDRVGPAAPNLRSYWQPRHGQPVEVGLGEIAALSGSGRLANIHAFHWWPSPSERHPLAAGRDRWLAFLRRIAGVPGDRFVLLEFTVGDAPESFLADAVVLRELLAEVG